MIVVLIIVGAVLFICVGCALTDRWSSVPRTQIAPRVEPSSRKGRGYCPAPSLPRSHTDKWARIALGGSLKWK